MALTRRAGVQGIVGAASEADLGGLRPGRGHGAQWPPRSGRPVRDLHLRVTTGRPEAWS